MNEATLKKVRTAIIEAMHEKTDSEIEAMTSEQIADLIIKKILENESDGL